MLHVEIVYFNEDHVRLSKEKFDTNSTKETIIADTKKKAVRADSNLHKLNNTVLTIWDNNQDIYQNTFDMFGH